jgi:valyl-tRNA synthetase
MRIPSKAETKPLINTNCRDKAEFLKRNSCYITHLTHSSSIEIGEIQKPKLSATAIVGDVEIYVPIKGLIDIEKERARLNREIEKIEVELRRVYKKLKSEDFRNKAPKQVVKGEEEKREELELRRGKLWESLKSLED